MDQGLTIREMVMANGLNEINVELDPWCLYFTTLRVSNDSKIIGALAFLVAGSKKPCDL